MTEAEYTCYPTSSSAFFGFNGPDMQLINTLPEIKTDAYNAEKIAVMLKTAYKEGYRTAQADIKTALGLRDPRL